MLIVRSRNLKIFWVATLFMIKMMGVSKRISIFALIINTTIDGKTL